MSKSSITCAAAALLAISSTALAQDNTANTINAVDPALNATADPLANDANVITTDPLANDPLMTAPATDPLAADPMLNATDDDDRDDDRSFPWGLLGLLGLVGLLGTRRRDDDVRVDTTRDTR